MKGLAAALAANRRKRDTAASAATGTETPMQQVTVRRSERLSSLLSKPEGIQTQTQDPGLSPDLLHGDDGVSPARELRFTAGNDDSDDDDDSGNNQKRIRLSVVNECSGSIETTPTARTVRSSKSPGGHGFPKRDSPSAELQCAARDLCKQQDRNDTLLSVTDTCICINCNFTAHLQCADNLFVQRPKEDGPINYKSKLSVDGKDRVKKFKGGKDDIMICLSCMSTIESGIQSKKGIGAPKKSKKATFEQLVKKIILELRNLLQSRNFS